MLSVQQRANATSIIDVQDDLDSTTSPALEAAISLAASASERVVVSLDNCSYCDSSALAVFIRAKRSLGSRFMLFIPDGHSIKKIFEITGLLAALSIYSTLEEAVGLENQSQSFSKNPNSC